MFVEINIPFVGTDDNADEPNDSAGSLNSHTVRASGKSVGVHGNTDEDNESIGGTYAIAVEVNGCSVGRAEKLRRVFTDLTASATMSITVTAPNSAGESPASAAVAALVP